jgi:hypothetical protein
MISVPEQSAIKILDIKKYDMSGECGKYSTNFRIHTVFIISLDWLS